MIRTCCMDLYSWDHISALSTCTFYLSSPKLLDQGCLHLHPLVQWVPHANALNDITWMQAYLQMPDTYWFPGQMLTSSTWIVLCDIDAWLQLKVYSMQYFFNENGGISLDFYWYWWRQMLLCVCLGWCLNTKPLVCKWDTLWWDQVNTVSPISSAFEVYFTYSSQMFMAIAFSNSLR